MRQRTVIGTVLCVTAMLVTGCASGSPGMSTGTAGTTGPDSTTGTHTPAPQPSGEHSEDAALGGVQPQSTDPADVLLDSAVSRAEDLTQHLGGHWDFPNEAGPFDAEQVRSGSSPQPCTTPAEDGQLTEGGLYSVVITADAPQEPAEKTLQRFETALAAAGYEPLQGNGTGPGEADALANGQSGDGRVTLTRSDAGALAINLRTACSTHQSLLADRG